MNEIQKEINNAYKMLSSLFVSGDQVDVVAAAKMALRRAFSKALDPEDVKGAKGDIAEGVVEAENKMQAALEETEEQA